MIIPLRELKYIYSAEPVKILSEAIEIGKKLIAELPEGCMALSAPQIGINKAAFVIKLEGVPTVLINPSITPFTTNGATFEILERCASLDEHYYKVTRPAIIKVDADSYTLGDERLEEFSVLYVARSDYWKKHISMLCLEYELLYQIYLSDVGEQVADDDPQIKRP